ncbi:MAG TPA: peptide-methionine (S)-S-oxide reductase MsrA [Chthonomonadales bacterium]|nr:peptide-methionine (S)-S-oxide reductase MsrA [Chthonomonadales bacterium]
MALTSRAGLLGLLCVAAVVAGCARWAAPNAVAAPAQRGGEGKVMERLPHTPVTVPEGREVATLAGGCFWCVEAILQELRGVDAVRSGYAGGAIENPSYEQVCTGRTGHAEAVEVTFDPKVLSYRDLLRVFLTTHDPTTLNRQGADVGTQYRSAIFTHGAEQAKAAREVIAEIGKARLYRDPIVTEVTAFTNFYPAEEYHRDYFRRNPNQGYCKVVIAPKVAKFREKHREKLRRPQP